MQYDFSGGKEEYQKLLRNYTLDELLVRINQESAKILLREEKDISFGVERVSYTLIHAHSRRPVKDDLIISIWNLIDLAYYATLFSNDYRGKTIKDDREFYFLCRATQQLMADKEKPIVEEIKDSPLLFLYALGFIGEQNKVQTQSAVFQNVSRELYILFEISKQVEGVNIEDIVQQETGVNWKVLISSLLLIWFGFAQQKNLKTIKELVNWDDVFKIEDFERVVARYTATYQEIRQSALKRQVFYAKPYVKTDRKEIISINTYLNLCIYEHCVLWAVRDYYYKKGSREFTSYFGKLFEKYLNELFAEYLQTDKYHRIPEVKNAKRADWKADLCGYKFLIEQKSTILRLGAKQQDSDYNAIVAYAKSTLIKALKQLEATEEALNNGKHIKVILLYEDYFMPEILDYVFRLEECDITNDDYYWIVTIDEMETLLYLCKHDPQKCQKIIEERIKRETEHSIDGKRLELLFGQMDVEQNYHLEQQKYLQYRTLAQDFVRPKLPEAEQDVLKD